MKGGGSWDEVCPCCGFPFDSNLDSIDYYYENDAENAIPIINNPNIDKWMEKAYVFLENGSRILAKDYNGYGLLYKDDDVGAAYRQTISIASFGNENGPVAAHRDCVTVIEHHLGRAITYQDIQQIKGHEGAPMFDYLDQYFQWRDAFEAKGEAYFASPIVNNALRNDIIASIPIMLVPAISNNLESVNLNAPGNNEGPLYNGLLVSEIDEGDVLGYFPNAAGKIFPSQGIVVRKAANSANKQSNTWRSVLASAKNPFTRAPIGSTTYRKAHIKAKTRRGGRRTRRRATRRGKTGRRVR